MEKTKPKMKISKFRYVPGVPDQWQSKKEKKRRDQFDSQCQEATPEIFRIELEQIFKEFLDNPSEEEYIFPADLNNLQRKFIHKKAQALNLTSKSHGKEPDRKIHIKKKQNQFSNMSFSILPGKATENCVRDFTEDIGHSEPSKPIYMKNQFNKDINRLWSNLSSIPSNGNTTNEITEIRCALPIFGSKMKIVQGIEENQITIISSETGSGKTTQVPQYIMELKKERGLPCKIICTQPRRISTVAAAERVAYERGENVGSSVGYHIKLEQKYGLRTNLIYCTTGVFVRNLMTGRKSLANISHIILDEIHERDKLSDFVLICLKQMLPSNPRLKIILMSATLTAQKFQKYFGCGHIIEIPGRLYPISTSFLEDILVDTGYMSPKMRALELKGNNNKIKEMPKEDKESEEIDEAVDDALIDYLNFCEDYDYKVHYEEATAQLAIFFLSEGVSVDYQHSGTGRTALMIASHLGDKEFITRLCNMGANMEMCDEMGRTAFDYARDNIETMQLLEYIKSHRKKSNSNERDSKAQNLLELYDKTTFDDFIDFDLLITLIGCIHKVHQPGSILVFVPGYDDIMMCNDRIMTSTIDPTSIRVFFLHSSMNIRDQHEVFEKIPNKRKIILSTNIAETSLTIDDVVFVIDTGKCKEKCFDSYNKVSSLQTRWVSQACAEQRKGRAGRTSPGMVFRLYSSQRFENMDKEKVPEMLRVSLEEICLHTKILAPENMNIHKFLMNAIDAPSANSIKVAIENLQFLGALDKEEDLTHLGKYLAQLAIEPHLGKILLFGVIFKCLEPILTLVSSMSHKDPFQLPAQANLRSVAAELRKKLLNGYMSDHLLFLEIFREWQDHCKAGNGYDFCRRHFISYPTMNSILETRSQLLAQLRFISFIHQSSSLESYNINAHSWPVVKAIISTGLYPNLAYPLNGYLANRREKKIAVQNASSCYNKPIMGHWLMYDEMVKQTSNLYIKGVSPISTLTVALMCGNDVIYPTPNTILIDDWIEFQYPFSELNNLRKRMEYLIKSVMIMPVYRYNDFDIKIVKTLKEVLNIEENILSLSYPKYLGEKPRFLLPMKEYSDTRHSTKEGHGENWRRTNGNNGNHLRERNTSTSDNWREPSTSGQNRNNSYDRHTMGISRSNSRPGNNERNFHYQTRNSRTDNSRSNYNNGFDNEVFMRHDNVSRVSESSNSPDRQYNEPIGRPSRVPVSETPDPATRLLNGLTGACARVGTAKMVAKKYGEVLDAKIYVLIKPRLLSNVTIAYESAKWVFAPHTEKKVLHYVRGGREVYLLFSVHSSCAFQGIAKYKSITVEFNGKPTARIHWIYQIDLPFNDLRHLVNPYNQNKPIYSGPDGQIVKQNIAEELCKIYEAKIQEKRNNSQQLDGRVYLSDSESLPSTSQGQRPFSRTERNPHSYYSYSSQH